MNQGILLPFLVCTSWYLVVQASPLRDDPYHWDYFVYTQQWPQGACIDANNSGHACAIPKNTTTWTIHGLWPNKNGTIGPNFCNNSSKFDPSQIVKLEAQLTQFWPNLYSDSQYTSFWKHEWEKHGTCASSLPAVRGEYNYFAMGLQLNKKYDLLNLLKAQGVVPDASKTYNATVVEAAVKAALHKHALVRCTYDHATKTHNLFEIEMCLDKKFTQIDCPQPEGLQFAELCPDTKPVYYSPIIHKPNAKKVGGRKDALTHIEASPEAKKVVDEKLIYKQQQISKEQTHETFKKIEEILLEVVEG